MKKLIFSFFIISNVSAMILIPKSSQFSHQEKMKDILVNVFYEELYKRTKNLKPEIEVKKAKISLNEGRRGKLLIEKMKQKNREKLARMRGFDPEKVKKGADLIKLQKEDNKEVIKKMNEAQARLEEKYKNLPEKMRKQKIWQEQAKAEMEEIRKKVLLDHKEWRKKHSKTLEEWAKKQKGYQKDIDAYKKTLVNFPLILPVSEKERKKDVEVKIIKDYHFVSSSLVPKIRDQKFRPTCSSFAGIRGIEILLAQNKRVKDLSEQYFYWASKPKCMNQKCNSKGSWVGNGLKFSQNDNSINIPLEKDCPYNNYPIKNNETQIPLNQGCSKGYAKVDSFKYISTLDDVINRIKLNRPVMASIKLTPNFYKNNGLILNKEANQGGKLDSHAAGHAVLLVGYLKLPKILNEGSVCFITANSWGEGWANGGYSCISENWIKQNRSRNPFVVVDQVRI